MHLSKIRSASSAASVRMGQDPAPNNLRQHPLTATTSVDLAARARAGRFRSAPQTMLTVLTQRPPVVLSNSEGNYANNASEGHRRNRVIIMLQEYGIRGLKTRTGGRERVYCPGLSNPSPASFIGRVCLAGGARYRGNDGRPQTKCVTALMGWSCQLQFAGEARFAGEKIPLADLRRAR